MESEATALYVSGERGERGAAAATAAAVGPRNDGVPKCERVCLAGERTRCGGEEAAARVSACVSASVRVWVRLCR